MHPRGPLNSRLDSRQISRAAGSCALDPSHICWSQEDIPPPPPPSGKETPSERAERLRREEIRKERARERERERRLEAKDAHGFKKSKLTRDRDRDVSEKMALGQVGLCRAGFALLGRRGWVWHTLFCLCCCHSKNMHPAPRP